MKKVLILNYHNISQNTSKDNLYTLSPEIFRQHLSLIASLKIPVIRMENVIDNSISEDYSILLSFDDGYKSDLNVALPLLSEHNFPAIFFPIVDMIGESGRLTWEDIKVISKKGFEIGSHGISHNNLTDLTLEELEKELKESRTLIEQQINRQINHFALPYGRYNKKIIEFAKRWGYKSILTTGLKCNTVNESSFLLYRWNITSKTSINSLKSILLSKGILPFKTRMVFSIKKIAKSILGLRLAEKINRKYTNG